MHTKFGQILSICSQHIEWKKTSSSPKLDLNVIVHIRIKSGQILVVHFQDIERKPNKRGMTGRNQYRSTFQRRDYKEEVLCFL